MDVGITIENGGTSTKSHRVAAGKSDLGIYVVCTAVGSAPSESSERGRCVAMGKVERKAKKARWLRNRHLFCWRSMAS